MINFRFHLVSLVAVFLALAIGVVMGYGILGQPTVSGLQDRIDNVEANAEAKRVENEQLKTDLDRTNQALDEASPFSVTGRLPNVPAIVVAVRDLDETAVERIVTLARRGGATVPGVVWLESKLTLESKDDAKALATLLGAAGGTRRAALRAEVWDVLASNLAGGANAPSRAVLAGLVSGGFVSLAGVEGDAPGVDALGGPGTRVVLAIGPSGSVASRFVVDGFATASVDAGVPLVVGEVYGESPAERGDALTPIFDDDRLAANVTTVDDLELTEGSIAAVLGLADLGRDVVGHYGFGNGATRLLPEWSQP